MGNRPCVIFAQENQYEEDALNTNSHRLKSSMAVEEEEETRISLEDNLIFCFSNVFV